MENKALFRTSLGGFNKEDVISYIDKMAKDAARNAEESEARIKELSESLSKAEERSAELEAQLEKIRAELSAKTAEASEKDEKIIALEEKVADLQNAVPADDTAAENKELSEKCMVLEEEISALNKKLDEYRELDSVHHDLGTIIMRAEKSAAEIVSRAQTEADKTVSHAIKQTEEALERRMDACNRIAQSFETGRISIDESCQRMLENLEAAKRAVDMFHASLEVSSKVLKDSVSSVTNEIINTEITNKEN